jgi:hypothetical protein
MVGERLRVLGGQSEELFDGHKRSSEDHGE